MAAKGGIDAQLERLRAIAANPTTSEARAELEKALRGKSNIVAARAAKIIGEGQLFDHERELVAAFARFMAAGSDKTCAAKVAIAEALAALSSHAESVWLAGVRHVQMEAAWGPPVDAAVPLRCACAAGLVNMRSASALVPLVHLLAEREPRSTPGHDAYVQTRSMAARALGTYGGDAAHALLRFRVLIGDEPEVVSECFRQLIELKRSLDPVRPYLDAEDEDLRQAAMLAAGESRLADAFQVLRECWERQVDLASRKVLCVAMAVTRKPEAIEFLVSLVRDAPEPAAAAAVEALAIFKGDDAMRSRVRPACCKRGGALLATFDEHFGS